MQLSYAVNCRSCGAVTVWLQEQSEVTLEGYTVTCNACGHCDIYHHSEITVTPLGEKTSTH
jgi:hypothetical protein